MSVMSHHRIDDNQKKSVYWALVVQFHHSIAEFVC